MTNPNYFYFDGLTERTVEREMTDEEYAEYLSSLPINIYAEETTTE